MDWYYAIGDERKGPVSENEFQLLVSQGIVTPETLVWREGMANWEPHGGRSDAGIAPPPVIGAVARGGVVCAGCGATFPASDVVSLAGGSYCAACKPLAVQRLKEGAADNSIAEEIRNQHLKHEASVKSVGILYYLGGAAMVVLGLISVFTLGGGGGGSIGPVIGGAALLLLLGIGQLWTGAGIRGLKRWARIPVGILSGIGLLGFPLGTVINGYILYLVFSEKGKTVFSDEYKAVIAQTPHIKYRTSLLVWIVLGLLLLIIGFGVLAAILGGSRR